MSNKLKLKKIAEAALAVASSDGLDLMEVLSTVSSLLSVPDVAETVKTSLSKHDIESENIDFSEFVIAFSELTEESGGFDSFELIEVTDKYAKEVSEVIGDDFVLNNMCLGIAGMYAAADGDISMAEDEAIKTLERNLSNIDREVWMAITKSLLSVHNNHLDD